MKQETAKTDFTVNGVTSKFRTLSLDEWQYLLGHRYIVNVHTGLLQESYTPNITYGGKVGLVLYPDDYVGDAISGTVEKLPEGVVFLPAAGCRQGSDFYEVGNFGMYWASDTYDEHSAYGRH